ncbi:unnamed protein product [Symbiodinium natans]|uniref:Uncharacterized protein n=1 Tax=Symbiodinium natans TaxID=878477 RepID=A0A812LXT1_9DINO|nr:unnamed protein product [Symbiodinium natans]
MSKKRIQEIMEQRRLNKIASSNAWHAKFVKKGVLREDGKKQPKSDEPETDEKQETAAQKVNPDKAKQKQEPSSSSGSVNPDKAKQKQEPSSSSGSKFKPSALFHAKWDFVSGRTQLATCFFIVRAFQASNTNKNLKGQELVNEANKASALTSWFTHTSHLQT